MASRDTNRTIFTVGIVAVGAFIAWKIFGKKGASQQASSGEGGVGSDYYAPSQPDTGNPLSNLLQSLLSGLGGGSKGGSSAGQGGLGGSGSSSSDGNYTSPVSSLLDAMTGYDYTDQETFYDEGSDLLDQGSGLGFLDSTILDSSAGQLAYQDANETLPIAGTFITDGSDGSANAVTEDDSSLADLQSPIGSTGNDGDNFVDGDDGGGGEDDG
jgi:hypothetical protein